MRKIGLLSVALLVINPTAQAQTAGKLPVAQGIWADQADNCATTTWVQLYDGTGYGGVGFDGAGPTGGLQPILRSAPGKNGFTNAWFDNNTSVDGDLLVKPMGPGKYMVRTISYGSGHVGGRVDVDDIHYKQCSFAQLSVKMQNLVRQRAPKVAPVGAVAAKPVVPPPAPPTAVVAPAPVGLLNIRPGHYLPAGKSCSDTMEMIFYYDGKRYGWIDAGPFNPNHMDPISGLKKKGNIWDAGYGSTYRVDGVERIYSTDEMMGNQSLRWCPANRVRAAARAR